MKAALRRNIFCISWKLLCLAGISFSGQFDLLAQSIFTNVSIAGLTAGPVSSALWWDYDNDGRLDFWYQGVNHPQLWRNTDSGFTNVPVTNAPNANFTSVAWGDYDNDGQPDLLLTTTTNFSFKSELWRNTGSGFANVPIPGLPQVEGGFAAWGDYDNDGRLDFLLSGVASNNEFITQLWRNTGNGFTNVPIPGLQGGFATITWADYDNDGWLDFMLTGWSTSQLWRNTGSGFTNVPVPGLPGVTRGRAVWGDYDGDGKLDFLLTGGDSGQFVAQLWRNTGDSFTNVPIPGLPGVQQASVAWADFDNDGRLDFLLAGLSFNGTSIQPISQLWRNTGNGFTNMPEAGLPGVYMGTAAWADFDQDGRLDLLLTGATDVNGFFGIARLWRNVASVASNTAPAAPAGLVAAVCNGVATLSWNAASDDHTPGSALSYNLRVGTTPGAGDVVAPQADASGLRRLAAIGNCQLRTNALLRLSPGRYYWSVQAIDGAFAGSAFAAPQTFTIPMPPLLIEPVLLPDGTFQFGFTNFPDAIFTALATTNLTLPESNWTIVEGISQIAPGQFQFSARQSATNQQRFYRLRSP